MLHNIVISTSSASTTNPSPIPHLRLVFSGDSQTLLLIEILSQTLISKLEWAGRPLIDSTSTAYSNIQRLLNAKFGPTYPSTSHPAFGTGTGYTHEQILTYPGVVFGFPSNSPQDRLTRVIVSRHDPSVPHAGAFPDIKQLEKLKPTLAAAGDVDRVEIILSDDGETAQLRVVTVQTDKQAETTTSEATDGPANAYFVNYFSLGLDFLIDGMSHKVLKVVIHGNLPGEIDHLRAVFANQTAASKTDIAEISATLNERAMLLDRTADVKDGLKLDRPTELHAFPGVIAEVTQEGCIETVWIV
ncbi:hypothetical protein EMMF5_006388 [Cystobasidiomycetes sp. EMM_F5]